MWFKRKENKELNENKCFIVACHGWSGSHWFSHALNMHPDVICTHSASNLKSDNSKMYSDEELKIRSVERYLNIKNKKVRSVDSYYDEICNIGEAKAYGSVHLLQLKDLVPMINKHGGFKRNYSIVNQVRHPLSFVWSGYGQLVDLFKYDVWVVKGTLDLIFGTNEEFFLSLAKKYNLNLAEPDVMAFVGACANLMNLSWDVNHARDYKFLPMEKLTTDKDYFIEVFIELTGFKPDDEYLDKVFDLGIINEHKRAKKLSPADRYATLNNWQKESFQEYLDMAGLQEKYESVGYSFEFIND